LESGQPNAYYYAYYFVSFFIIAIILLLNLMIAVVLDSFMLEQSLQASEGISFKDLLSKANKRDGDQLPDAKLPPTQPAAPEKAVAPGETGTVAALSEDPMAPDLSKAKKVLGKVRHSHAAVDAGELVVGVVHSLRRWKRVLAKAYEAADSGIAETVGDSGGGSSGDGDGPAGDTGGTAAALMSPRRQDSNADRGNYRRQQSRTTVLPPSSSSKHSVDRVKSVTRTKTRGGATNVMLGQSSDNVWGDLTLESRYKSVGI